jgi:uncharacterized glyoxalase superfamily protein PhnB
MKTSLLTFALVTILGSTVMAASQTWTFNYKPKSKESFTLTMQAETKQEAFKVASKACFQKLTNGVYPGEETGLEYIDICANPKM